MPGTTRELQRALSAAFEAWDNAAEWENHPSPEIRALYDIIDAYTERHNTLSSMGSSFDPDLREAYLAHVKGSENVSKETFFLEILSRLSPTLGTSEIRLWLETYLRPAVDCAGLDLKFVAKAKAFLKQLTMEVYPTPDRNLYLTRAAIAEMVMDYILQIFIGNNPNAYKMIGLKASVQERNTQLHIERIRFIENNASSLLREWGLKNPRPFFDLLDRYFQDAKMRCKVLLLASSVASSNSSKVQTIMDSRFFNSLLRSALLDMSESIICGCLSVLMMTVCKVCHRIAEYLPELLALYCRLACWKRFVDANILDTKAFDWDFAVTDQNVSIMQTQIYSEGEFNMSYYLTLMYGLFPLNLLSFSRSPSAYFANYPPKVLTRETGYMLKFLSSTDVNGAIALKCFDYQLRFFLHPNILNALTPAQEWENPIKWVLDRHQHDDIGEEEVLIECFKFNPEIMVAFPDDIILPDKVLQKIQSTTSFTSEGSDRRFLHSMSGYQLKDHSSPSSHRGSVLSHHDPIHTSNNPQDGKLANYWQYLDRRVSIVPTSLVLESSGAQPNPDNSEIKFKSIDFDGDRKTPEPTAKEEKQPKKDFLTDLHTVHERLFSTSSTQSSNATTLNVDTVESSTAASSAAFGTASDSLSKHLKPDIKSEAPVEATKEVLSSEVGTALDFYQRELLLMKNEMEFSSYMKHVTKINYIKLKSKYNQLLKEQTLEMSSGGKVAEKAVSISEFNALVGTIKELQLKHDELAVQKSTECNQLSLVIENLKEENRALATSQNAKEKILEEKNQLIEKLRADLSAKDERMSLLSNSMANRTRAAKDELPRPVERSKSPELETRCSSPFLSERDQTIFDLETRLKLMQDQKSKIVSELSQRTQELDLTNKMLESQAADEKLKLSEALREQARSYERKIQELNTIMLQYESKVGEQKAQIIQLSKAKPMNIPGLMRKEIKNNGAFESEHAASLDISTDPPRDASNASVSSSLVPHPPELSQRAATIGAVNGPPRQPSSSSMPIIKGRGGYQKRSKKAM